MAMQLDLARRQATVKPGPRMGRAAVRQALLRRVTYDPFSQTPADCTPFHLNRTGHLSSEPRPPQMEHVRLKRTWPKLAGVWVEPDVRDEVVEYNERRLHSAIGYVTPKDKLEGRAEAIQKSRDSKLEEARELRRIHRELNEDRPGAGGGLSPQYQNINILSQRRIAETQSRPYTSWV